MSKKIVAMLNKDKGLFYIGNKKSSYEEQTIAVISEAEATQFTALFAEVRVGETNVYALSNNQVFALADIVANGVQHAIRVAAGLPGTMPAPVVAA